MKHLYRLYFFMLMSVWHAAFSLTAAQDLTQKLNAIRALSADFSQMVTAHQRSISTSTGHMMIQRPGRFRWETKSPNQQLILADGKRIWIYDVELEQVTSKPQANLKGTPAVFLTGSNEHLAQDFEVVRVAKGNEERYELHAKAVKSPFPQVVLIFRNQVLASILLDDQLNQHTQVHLKQVRANESVAASMFQFKPPKGVDVIYE